MHQWTIQMKLSQVDKSINLSLSLNWTNWTLTVHLPWVARGMIQSLLWCRWRRKCKLLGCSTSCLFCFLVLLFSRFSIGDTGWCFFLPARKRWYYILGIKNTSVQKLCTCAVRQSPCQSVCKLLTPSNQPGVNIIFQVLFLAEQKTIFMVFFYM